MATKKKVASNETPNQTIRKTFIGTVVSNKNDKTITVLVETAKTHPIYHKRFKSSKKYHAHDENNQAHIGDVVEIAESRPMSALKRFRLVKILKTNTPTNSEVK